jgi:hypothetical protein
MNVEQAPLPIHRIETVEAYQNTGVDLAGPISVHDKTKYWIVLFTCAVYRAVHLDVIKSLSTEAFLGSLERFINFNGRPEDRYSDNGTYFTGAVNLFDKKKRTDFKCQVKKIR